MADPQQDALNIAQALRDAATDPVVQGSLDETINHLQTKIEENNA